jgi:hypothetical protein
MLGQTFRKEIDGTLSFFYSADARFEFCPGRWAISRNMYEYTWTHHYHRCRLGHALSLFRPLQQYVGTLHLKLWALDVPSPFRDVC